MRQLKVNAAMLLRDLLGVESQELIAKEMSELYLLAICDLLSKVHLKLILVVLVLITKELLILVQLSSAKFKLMI